MRESKELNAIQSLDRDELEAVAGEWFGLKEVLENPAEHGIETPGDVLDYMNRACFIEI
jgi:hypothetical protein